jgi:hypothetical protein
MTIGRMLFPIAYYSFWAFAASKWLNVLRRSPSLVQYWCPVHRKT